MQKCSYFELKRINVHIHDKDFKVFKVLLLIEKHNFDHNFADRKFLW